tara:strand:+ start:1489 stop:2433 length:945 start_codon:yes stop_codon:yes gene_type:complete
MKENNLLAITYIMLGMTAFALQDTVIRLLAVDISILQVMFARSIVALILLTLFLKITKKEIILKTAFPKLSIFRTVMFILAFVFYYIGLHYLTFAEATALFFTAPFFITIFSGIFLKEKIGLIRWAIIVYGFIGVLFIVSPNINSFNVYMIYPILCAAGYSANMIIIKYTSEKDNVYTQTLHVYIATIIICPIITFSGIFLDFGNSNSEVLNFLFRNWYFNDPKSLIMIFIVGVSVIFGFVFLFNAYRHGRPYIIAPFEYIFLIWAVILGWFIWSETVDLKTWTGIAIIVSAGIFILYREKIRDQNITTDQPIR